MREYDNAKTAFRTYFLEAVLLFAGILTVE